MTAPEPKPAPAQPADPYLLAVEKLKDGLDPKTWPKKKA